MGFTNEKLDCSFANLLHTTPEVNIEPLNLIDYDRYISGYDFSLPYPVIFYSIRIKVELSTFIFCNTVIIF